MTGWASAWCAITVGVTVGIFIGTLRLGRRPRSENSATTRGD